VQTSLDDDELIEAVELPAPGRWGFAEFARRHGDFGLVVAAAEAAAGEIEPAGDIHASAAYRRQLTRVLITRALTQAAGARAAQEGGRCRSASASTAATSRSTSSRGAP
jgi:carbon-monoxide dehydrogenase medium subunit